MTGPQAAITTAAKVTASHVAASWTRQAPPPPPPSARRSAPAAGLPDAPHPGRLCTPAGRASAGAGALGAAGVWRARPGPVAARRGGPEPVSDARRPGPSGTARRRPAGEDALDPVTAADQGRGGDHNARFRELTMWRIGQAGGRQRRRPAGSGGGLAPLQCQRLTGCRRRARRARACPRRRREARTRARRRRTGRHRRIDGRDAPCRALCGDEAGCLCAGSSCTKP